MRTPRHFDFAAGNSQYIHSCSAVRYDVRTYTGLPVVFSNFQGCSGISSLVFAILDPESAIGDPTQPGTDNLAPQNKGSGLRSLAVIYR